MRLRARPPVPAEVMARLTLPPGDRVLAGAQARDGRWCVGSAAACHLLGDDGVRTLPWEQLERADWDTETDTLTLVESAEWGEPENVTQLVLDDPRSLLELVRERITKSVLFSRFTRVVGKRGLSVVGRRSPTGDGPITWSYVVSAGLDPADPLLVEAAETALAEARRELADL